MHKDPPLPAEAEPARTHGDLFRIDPAPDCYMFNRGQERGVHRLCFSGRGTMSSASTTASVDARSLGGPVYRSPVCLPAEMLYATHFA